MATSKRKQLAYFVSEYWQELSFLFFLIVAFAVYSRTSELASWDDFTFWASASKELLKNHIFEYNLAPTAILDIHAHYPRGPAIYHYFMLLLPGYSEGGALFAHFLLHLAFIAPLMANKRWYHSAFFIFVIFAAVVHYTTGLRSIYNDSTTGLLFASFFLIYFSETDKLKALFLILPIMMFFPIFRETGLVLGLIATFILIYFSCGKVSCQKALPLYVAMLLLPYMIQSAWFWYFAETHQGLGRNQHTLDNFILILQSFNDNSWLIAANYMKFMLKFLLKEGSIVVYILFALSWFGVKKYNAKLANEWRSVFTALVLGFLVFALWRLYLYYAIFSEVEAVQARSITRYCGTYWLVFAVMACYYIKHSTFLAKALRRAEIAVFTIIALAASVSVLQNVTRVKKLMDPEIATYNKYIDYVSELISQGKIVQFNYSNKHNGIDCYKLNYKISPHLSARELFQCLGTEDAFEANAASKEFKELEEKKDGRVIYYPFLNKVRFE